MGTRASKDITTDKEPRRKSVKKSESIDENAKYRDLRTDETPANGAANSKAHVAPEPPVTKETGSDEAATSSSSLSSSPSRSEAATKEEAKPEAVAAAEGEKEATPGDETHKESPVVERKEASAEPGLSEEATAVAEKEKKESSSKSDSDDDKDAVSEAEAKHSPIDDKDAGVSDPVTETVSAGQDIQKAKREALETAIDSWQDERDDDITEKSTNPVIVVEPASPGTERHEQTPPDSPASSVSSEHREERKEDGSAVLPEVTHEVSHSVEVSQVTEEGEKHEQEKDNELEQMEEAKELEDRKNDVAHVEQEKHEEDDKPEEKSDHKGEKGGDSDSEGSVSSASSHGSSSSGFESVVCDTGDMKDGEMKEVDIGDKKILLVKENGEFHALGSKCTHYGAPLAKGSLCNGKVRCPWHGACFDVKTGDIEDFPGLDSLPKFDVDVHDGKVKIRAKKDALEKSRRQKSMVKRSEDDNTTVLIVGGGPAALTCAETLRQEGFKGRVVMATKEKHLPYDRPKLSKVLDVTPEQVVLRHADFFKEYDIEVQTEKEVTAVNLEDKRVTFRDESHESYDKLLLAVGATPRRLPDLPDLENITTLRSVDDASFIAKQAKDKNVVLIGTSFIGVETAACLADKAKSVTIVDLVEAPFQLALGKEVGHAVQKLLDEKGVKSYFQNSAKEFVGDDGRLTHIILRDDTKLDADLCVIGIGVVPATDFLKTSSIPLTDRGFVPVDKHMRTETEGVFAAGDITHFPLFMADDDHVNIQHWQMAHQQGRIAALNMLDKAVEIHSVPFFWTMLFGKSLRYTGYGVGYDEVLIHGSTEDLKFIAYYVKGERVVAVATLNNDPVAAQAAQLWNSGRQISKEDIQNESQPSWQLNV